MLHSYFLAALRSLIKDPVNAGINILGLALGLACCLILLSFIVYQLSFDAQFKDIERVYLLQSKSNVYDFDGTVKPSMQSYVLTLRESTYEIIKNNLANVEQTTSLKRGRISIQRETEFHENIYYTDSAFFDVFNLAFLEGDRSNVLERPDAVVLTASMARKYFGNNPAIGQVLALRDRNLTVAGVIEDIPENSHLKIKDIGMLASLKGKPPQFNKSIIVYLKIKNSMSMDELNRQINQLFSEQYKDEVGLMSVSAAEIRHLHLNNKASKRSEKKPVIFQSWVFIYAAAGLALSVLIISCINFVNLTTARFSQRHREIGMRKVLGAGQRSIFWQFICEAFVLTLISVLIAYGISLLALPWFNALVQTDLSDVHLANSMLFLGLPALIVITTVLSGFYPSVVLSQIKPVAVLASSGMSGSKSRLRRVLTVLQFSFSIFLITICLTFYYQINYLKNFDIGYDLNNLAEVQASDRQVLADKLQAYPGVLGVSAPISAVGFVAQYRLGNSEPVALAASGVDDDFFDFYKINMLAGERFLPGAGSHEASRFMLGAPEKNGDIVLTLSGLEKLGFSRSSAASAIGKKIDLAREGVDVTMEIIGVADACPKIRAQRNERICSDYIALSEYIQPFQPVAIRFSEGVRVNEILESIMLDNPELAISLGGLSYPKQQLSAVFSRMKRVLPSVALFAFVAIGIAILGLYAMSAFLVGRRTREIGIRKALGASRAKITALLLWDFGKPVFIALALAAPLANIYAGHITDHIAARIPVEWIAFGAVPLMTIMIALLVVSGHTMKAATVAPVSALRHE